LFKAQICGLFIKIAPI